MGIVRRRRPAPVAPVDGRPVYRRCRVDDRYPRWQFILQLSQQQQRGQTPADEDDVVRRICHRPTLALMVPLGPLLILMGRVSATAVFRRATD